MNVGLLVLRVVVGSLFTAHGAQKLFGSDGGFEFPLLLGTFAFAVTAVGPGSLSLDNALGIDRHGLWWALGAAGLGLADGLGSWAVGRVELGRRHHLREA